MKELILTGISAQPPHPLVRKVARGKHRRVKWWYTEQAADAITSLKADGYTSCALEVTEQSIRYDEVDYPDKICLIVGHEDHGVTKRTLAACDMVIFLPMYGAGASLNRSCLTRYRCLSHLARFLIAVGSQQEKLMAVRHT